MAFLLAGISFFHELATSATLDSCEYAILETSMVVLAARGGSEVVAEAVVEAEARLWWRQICR